MKKITYLADVILFPNLFVGHLFWMTLFSKKPSLFWPFIPQ